MLLFSSVFTRSWKIKKKKKILCFTVLEIKKRIMEQEEIADFIVVFHNFFSMLYVFIISRFVFCSTFPGFYFISNALFLGILKVRNQLIGCSAFLCCLEIVVNENCDDYDATAEYCFYEFLRIYFYEVFERFGCFYFVYNHGY